MKVVNSYDGLDTLAHKYKTDKGTRHYEGMTLTPKGYTVHYDNYFSLMKVNALLEIGVGKGGSLRMWEELFPNAEIYGIDINPKCKQHETKRTKVFIGSQANKKFLEKFCSKITEPLDIIIDDGSHVPADQITSFETLFPVLSPGGYYVIEDLRTHYTSNHLKKSLWFFNEIMANLHRVENHYPIESIYLHRGIVFIKKAKQ